MNVSPQERQWHCDRCPSVFGRLDHLKRHALTHTTERSHVCQFCGAFFSRGDVLRRHWKSCKDRIENGDEIPESQRGGKHRRACDSCANIRKACNGDIPCSECTHRGRLCTYQRLGEGDENSADINQADVSQTQKVGEDQGSGVKLDIPEDGPSWDLGPQSFYPNRDLSKIVYSRNRYGT